MYKCTTYTRLVARNCIDIGVSQRPDVDAILKKSQKSSRGFRERVIKAGSRLPAEGIKAQLSSLERQYAARADKCRQNSDRRRRIAPLAV